jgi:hypothetical protein
VFDVYAVYARHLFDSGRLKYTTGDTEGAVNTFITLLHSANAREATKGDDGIYIEDFRLALEVQYSRLFKCLLF